MTAPTFTAFPAKVRYPDCIEHAIRMIEPLIEEKTGGRLNSRWLSLRLLHQDCSLLRELSGHLGEDFLRDPELLRGITLARKQLKREVSSPEQWNDAVAGAIVSTAEKLCRDVVSYENSSYRKLDFAIDRLFTSRLTGFPLMLLLLAVIFWITIYGANYPSALLSDGLFFIQDRLTGLFTGSTPLLAPRSAGAGTLPGAGLGRIGDASAHGHLFPALYAAGRRRIPAPHRLQSG